MTHPLPAKQTRGSKGTTDRSGHVKAVNKTFSKTVSPVFEKAPGDTGGTRLTLNVLRQYSLRNSNTLSVR